MALEPDSGRRFPLKEVYMSEIHISFLAHSGFAVETATKVLVFDYYKDDKKIVDAYAKGSKPLWFFISPYSSLYLQ